MNEELTQLESSVNSKNMRQLDIIKGKKDTYEKYLSENVSKMEEIKNIINELDSAIEVLKKNIGECLQDNKYKLLHSVLRGLNSAKY